MSKPAFSKEQMTVAKDHLQRKIGAGKSVKRVRTPPQIVTITISGPCGTGKSFIKYAIAKMITKKLGLKVEIEELEMRPEVVEKFLSKKKEIKKVLQSMKDRIVYKVTDISTFHSLAVQKQP